MRILIVEDEPRLAATLGKGLRAEGFVVVDVATGIDGLWQATENAFDVIVLDIMLPGLSGYEVLRQLRAREVWTPVALPAVMSIPVTSQFWTRSIPALLADLAKPQAT